MNRDGYIFYRSFYEAVKSLPAKEFKECITALSEYALNGQEVTSSAVAQMFLAMAKPQIDANNRRYENGKKGGRPKKEHITIETPEWYQKQKNGETPAEIKADENLINNFETMKKSMKGTA